MSFRFAVGDRVRVSDIALAFAPGSEGEIYLVEYISDNTDTEDAEYTVRFDIPFPNPSYSGNEEWESPEFEQAYYSDNELEFSDRKKNPRRISGFGRFIQRLESNE